MKNEIFNKYGVPSEEDIKDTQENIRRLADSLFEFLIKTGASLTEVQAVAYHLNLCITNSCSERILAAVMEMKKEEKNKS